MFKRRRVVSLLFCMACFGLMGSLIAFVSKRQEKKICEKVYISIDNEYNNYFISDKEIKNILTQYGANKLEGVNISQINLKNLENRLKSHKFVQDAQVSRDLAGNIKIEIQQNRPIARIVHPDSEQDVYIDEDGSVLPLSERYTARVIPITSSENLQSLTKGFFQDSTGKSYLALLKFIEKDNFWKAQLAQMHIDAKGKISFMAQIGNETIEFGQPEDIEQKFKKILIFYRKVLPAMGWDKYRRVNVEFKDQIICE